MRKTTGPEDEGRGLEDEEPALAPLRPWERLSPSSGERRRGHSPEPGAVGRGGGGLRFAPVLEGHDGGTFPFLSPETKT